MLREAHAKAEARGAAFTDDASLLGWAGYEVRAIDGDPENAKITTLADLAERTDGWAVPVADARVGLGFDVHRFDEARPLWLGGVRFDGEPGLAGHSDGDVVCHAIADALLGAVALGDVGEHFPDTDPATAGIAGRGAPAPDARDPRGGRRDAVLRRRHDRVRPAVDRDPTRRDAPAARRARSASRTSACR